MREIVLDTETTGLNPLTGDRLVEVGCVELINHLPTGAVFHRHVNPERDMPEEAFKVHGLSAAFLADKPIFAAIAEDLLTFLADSPLVIHNAEFDMRFLNAELSRLGQPALPMNRAIDTVLMARKRFPGAQANLDALCRRFGIDNSHRTQHGALLDAELLAEVYLQLIGGRQPGLELGPRATAPDERTARPAPRVARPARVSAPSPAESEAHRAFLDRLKAPIWRRRGGED